MKKDILTQPFPASAVKQRQGPNGRHFSYVPTHEVVRRLNDGCDAWNFEILRHEILAEEVVVLGQLTVEDCVKKAAFGGSSITRDHSGREVSLADDLKAAASDALKKAASLLGVGLELYGGAAPGTATAPTRGAEDRLTQRQYSAIESVVNKRKMAVEQLGSFLQKRFQKTSMGELTRREASALLSELAVGDTQH